MNEYVPIQDHPEHCSICEECGKMLAYPPNDHASIQSHKKSLFCKRVSENGVKCPICDKELRKSTIHYHIRAVHEQIQRSCTLCSFTCSSSTSLKRHQLTHTGTSLHDKLTIAKRNVNL